MLPVAFINAVKCVSCKPKKNNWVIRSMILLVVYSQSVFMKKTEKKGTNPLWMQSFIISKCLFRQYFDSKEIVQQINDSR